MTPDARSFATISESDVLDFSELWRAFNRYKGRVLGITLVFAILGTLAAFSETPLYQATVTVLVEARANRPVQVQEVYDPGYGSSEYYGTQFELLQSRELAGRVVDRLDLTTNPSILPVATEPTIWQRLRNFEWQRWLPFLPAAEPPVMAEETAEQKRERAINAVLARVGVTPVRGTQLMRVHIESVSPPLAAAIANAWGDLFVESGLESRLDTTERATRWLTQRLADLRTKLEASERGLQAYREKNQLINIGGTRGLFEEELMDNSRKLREAQSKKTQFASTYWKIQQAGDDDRKLREVSSLLLDPPVEKAGEHMAQAEQAVKQLEERYGSKHPQMSAAQARLQAATRAYYSQLRLAANGVKAEYEIAAETERALSGVVQTGKDQIRRMDQRDFELRSLERESLGNRDLYELFLKRFKETDTASTYEPLNARIVDRAIVPQIPYKPNKLKVVILWTLCGFLLGAALAAFRHFLVETIRSPDQLEHLTQLPVLSVLPQVSGFGRKTSPTALCLDQPRAPFSEGVRSIRASLYLNDVDKRMKRIMFTSALPREGKSSLSSCFAVTLGQMEKVLLLEADLRAPTLKKNFGIPKETPGLVEVLTGQAELAQALYHHAPSGIHVLPVAQIPANPAEVISSAAFLKLIETLSTTFSRIIFDSPPCSVSSDSQLLAHRMDAVIFVIKAGTTGQRAIQTAIKQLRAAHAPLLGHVLNQVDTRQAYGYDSQYYGYDHRYYNR